MVFKLLCWSVFTHESSHMFMLRITSGAMNSSDPTGVISLGVVTLLVLLLLLRVLLLWLVMLEQRSKSQSLTG